MSDNYHPLGLQRGIVRVVDADPRWPQLFRAEADRLAAAVNKAGLAPLALEHVGDREVTDENDVGALSAPGSIERLGGGGQPVHSTAF